MNYRASEIPGLTGARLTKRELEILQLICQELTYEEIAVQLKVSKRTVSFHVSNMLAKTGHRNIVGLAVDAVKNNYYKSV